MTIYTLGRYTNFTGSDPLELGPWRGKQKKTNKNEYTQILAASLTGIGSPASGKNERIPGDREFCALLIEGFVSAEKEKRAFFTVQSFDDVPHRRGSGNLTLIRDQSKGRLTVPCRGGSSLDPRRKFSVDGVGRAAVSLPPVQRDGSNPQNARHPGKHDAEIHRDWWVPLRRCGDQWRSWRAAVGVGRRMENRCLTGHCHTPSGFSTLQGAKKHRTGGIPPPARALCPTLRGHCDLELDREVVQITGMELTVDRWGLELSPSRWCCPRLSVRFRWRCSWSLGS